MKIEAAKNQAAQENKTSKPVYRNGSSNFDSQPAPKSAEHSAALQSGAFSKILEETRRQPAKEAAPDAGGDAPETDSTVSQTERQEKADRAGEEKKDTAGRGGDDGGDGETGRHADENPTPLPMLAGWAAKTAVPPNAPAARSILHVADLERIVSFIRTEQFQNQKQITIALNNSVLQGLQIRLTLAANGKVKAEFLALGEQVKKLLDQRKSELSAILKNRAPLFSEIEIKDQEKNEQD